jgi:hypothetical protein
MPENIVEMIVVYGCVEKLSKRREFAVVPDKTNAIERRRLRDDLNLIVVAMQPAAWMFGR